MPHLISREQAMSEILTAEKPGLCLVCNLLDDIAMPVLYRGIYASVLLSKYPRFWGQTMICLHRHIEKFEELQQAEWEETSKLTLQFAKKIEQQLKPARVFAAALGSTQPLLHTCPHLHINLIPVYDETLKPDAVFTWANGVYAGDETEWESLTEQLRD